MPRERFGVVAGGADRALKGHQACRPPARATTGAGIMLSRGLRLGMAAVSLLTISSQRTCALRSVSLAGMPRTGVGTFTRSALVRSSPARRRTRVIMGGAACRGRYGPGWQSPVSPYKLGNRVRLATFPPSEKRQPFVASANACPHLFGGTQQRISLVAVGRLVAPRRHQAAWTHATYLFDYTLFTSTLHRASAYGK
jgi:hypothetical protein